MKRTKEWWARLTDDERIQLVNYERADKHHSGCSGYLPDGYGNCPVCSMPARYGGLCSICLKILISIIDKADGKERANDDTLHGKR